MLKFFSCFFTLIVSVSILSAQRNNVNIDSVLTLRERSRNENKYSLEKRILFANRSLDLANRSGLDSSIIRSTIRLGNLYFLSDSDLFFKYYYNGLSLAKKTNDKNALALIYSDLALAHYYLGKVDSAYSSLNKALNYKDYTNPIIRYTIYENLAHLQRDYGFLIQSERNLIKALAETEKLKNQEEILENKSSINFTLGRIRRIQKRYDEALQYYNNVIELDNELIKNGFESAKLSKSVTFNNIAEVYQDKKDYDMSFDYYNKALEDEYSLQEDPSLLPFVKSNILYNEFLKGEMSNEDIIYELKSTSESVEILNENYDKSLTELSISIHLARIYWSQKNLDSTLKYANNAYHTAKDLGENTYALESLKLMSEADQNVTRTRYLQEYIRLSDSINNSESSMRNKFAHIEYLSNQLEIDNTRLAKQKKWLYIILVGILIISLLVYNLLVQRSRNRNLEFTKAQQKANEDIYKLMLSQQLKLEEGRQQERNRVAEELHDGILSEFFSTRLGLSILELKGEEVELNKFQNYLTKMSQLENEVRQLSHNLKSDEFNYKSDFNSLLESLLQEQTKLFKTQYKFMQKKPVNWSLVSDKIKVNVYRIIQEALHNAIKHANAKNITLCLDATNSFLKFTLKDDGDGFNAKKTKQGIGLKNIKSRLSKLDGTFNLETEPTKGTHIEATIPLNIMKK